MTNSDDVKRRKEKKRPEEIAIEIKEEERFYEEQLKESRKLLDIIKKEYEYLVNEQQKTQSTAQNKVEETKKQIIIKAGRILERFYEKKKISARLQRDLYPWISKGRVRVVINEAGLQWTQKNKGSPGNRGRARGSDRSIGSLAISKPLTAEEQDYKQAYEQELIQGELFQKVIKRLTNKENKDFVDIRKRTALGKHWAHTLVEESKEHMLIIAHQMTNTALQDTLDELRVIKIIADGFSDIVYSVTKQREKQPGA